MLHGYDVAVWAELHIERALRTVKHRIPLDLGKILHGLAAVGTGRILRVLYPVGKAADVVSSTAKIIRSYLKATNGAIPFCAIIRLLHNINSP